MAKFDRSAVRFSMKETGKGYFQFNLQGSKYDLDDIEAVLATMAKNPGDNLNQYQLWLDWEKAPTHKEPVKFSQVVKYAKTSGAETTLVLTRRPFPQVKIKITKDGGAGGGKKTASNLREL